MLSGQPLTYSACGRDGRGVALRIDRDDLFDLLGERPELLRELFEGMFRIGGDTAGCADYRSRSIRALTCARAATSRTASTMCLAEMP